MYFSYMSETVVTGSDRTKAIFTMLRCLVLCVAVLGLPARAQPASCREGTHCPDGYYCETDANICRECLSCEDLKREPPLAINTCIKSVAECGSCINELVVDRHGDVNAECVPPDPQLEPTPSYVWMLIGIGVLLFLALVVGIIAYLLRYPEIFKTTGSNQSSTVTARITATAPEAPPPYNPLAQSPYHLPPYSDVETTTYNEDEQFIKRSPSSRPQDARESAGNQAARVYNKPLYEQDPPTPSAESPVPEYTETLTLPIHDEDTMPSPWIPGTTSNKDVNAKCDKKIISFCGVAPDNNANEPEGAGSALSAQLSAARDTTLVEHSAAKKRCVRQDSRESNSGDSSHSSFPRPGSPSAGGPPFSFITQITNVVQINTTK